MPLSARVRRELSRALGVDQLAAGFEARIDDALLDYEEEATAPRDRDVVELMANIVLSVDQLRLLPSRTSEPLRHAMPGHCLEDLERALTVVKARSPHTWPSRNGPRRDGSTIPFTGSSPCPAP